MAIQKAPERTPNAANAPVKVYDQDGNETIMGRLNALDLVRAGTHYWNPTDAYTKTPEDEGPANPTAKMVTIYDKQGNTQEFTMVNARELVRGGNYFWNDPADLAKSDEKAEAEVEAAKIKAGEAEHQQENEDSEKSEAEEKADEKPEIDVYEDPLVEQAKRVEGNDNVEAYLDGFTEANLRDLSEKRYGVKQHHRANKSTIIESIVELENEKTAEKDAD